MRDAALAGRIRALSFSVLISTLLRTVSAMDTPRLPLSSLSVSCRNLETVLYWNYSHAVRRALFSVEIWSYNDGVRRAVEKCTNVTRHHCDVSSSITDLSDTYALCVKAAAGSEESSNCSETFTYNTQTNLQKPCLLDFPAVNITAQAKEIILRFPHPKQVFKRLKQTLKPPNLKQFNYEVIYQDGNNTEEHVHKFTCNQKHCEAKFPFIEEKGQHCISVKGTLDYLIFNSAQKICTEEQPEKPIFDIIKITVIVISLTVSVVVLLLVIGWFVFQCLTKRRVSLPKSLVSRLKPGFRPAPTLGRGEEHISQVCSVGTSPCSTPLIQEDKTNKLTGDSLLDDCLRFKIGPENCGELNETLVVALPEGTDHGLGTEEGQSVSAVMDQQDSGGSADLFTTGFNSSGYDRPKVLTVEMGPGDTAEGYSHTQL
ncbi:interferon gamma receptor 1-like precursor [Lepisosteus oculatus]|uniref:growth/differentiation factor 10b precursor n=1 Tax=Lepisosteus oculatus TaxID=7918 RepID=UPI00074027BF|nr:interferon gamma receptor 1-like precursor [Lepisosteus oculatus]